MSTMDPKSPSGVSDPEAAGSTANIREARRAFRRFYATCFWYCRKDLEIGLDDVEWVAETLRKNGDMRAWKAAARLIQPDRWPA